MRVSSRFAFVLAAGCGLSLLPTSSRAAEKVSLDFGWRFYRGDFAESSQPGLPITTWRYKDASANEAPPTSMEGDTWKNVNAGDDPFNGREGFGWFVATIPPLPNDSRSPRVLQFSGVDDNASVYVNGKKLLTHSGWNDPFEVPADSAWRPNAPNVVAVLVENTAGRGGMDAASLMVGATATPAEVRPDFNDSTWRMLDVPHDFVVENDFDNRTDAGHGSKPTGVGLYRRTFNLTAADKTKTLWLDFQGVYRNSRVWLNGQLLGRWQSGYAPFRYDISKVAKVGKNTLVVRADARASEGWWYEGGGIYRHVSLVKANPLHIAPDGIFVSTKMAEPQNGKVASATVVIKTELENAASNAANCRLVSRIIDPNGKVVASISSSANLAAKASQTWNPQIVIAAPRLWSVETPTLYRLQTQLLRGQQVLDEENTPFGFRTIRFDAAKGLFLNGQPLKIKGTCNHQDFAGVGIALTDSILDWRVKKLKEMGSNAYRTSHNPVAQELLDACDRQGMLVMDETRHLGDATGAKSSNSTPYDDLSELKAMVKRDRNHPSIIMWSMANEEGLQSTAYGAKIFKAMKVVTDGLDGTRPVTAAMNGGHTPEGFHSVQDIEGFNYDIGGYDRFHQAYPNFPMYGSETASAVATRGEYVDDRIKGYVSNYDQRGGGWANTAQDAWKALATRDFMAGGFVWTGFDYRGEPTPYGWPCINSHFGIMDMCGFPKDPYYYYQAWWGNQPLVHIFPHWNWPGKEGQDVRVWAYSNAAKVELILNGKSLGTREMPPYEHVEWNVPYATGILEARGYDAAGKLVSTDKVETTGAPASLELKVDRTALKANKQDMAMVEVDVLDSKGRIVPTASDTVNFSLAGPGRIVGVGNGDPSSHESDILPTRRAFNGRCMVIVGSGLKAGTLRLNATAPGLKAATLTFSVK